ncbi:signal transduction protein [Hydrogenovibrio sp. SC-1]|uniref:HDOD domain-containing protein n=1 Tax=Hydrogenovibrio sp. SC-1 TaxID=2065820 RepID=UPI000C7DA1F2|nr:HDOD domain-containing protein [Hydrogenovibrio sp. SC-1]PLA75123.1 signal transduction protein [Hydrogenovibrio sp. SC-1]
MQSLIEKASEILKSQSVPNVPEEVLLLQAELNFKYPNTVKVANLISHNPELLAGFLKLVNTNITSEDRKVQDAKAAVNVLGLDEINNIFLSSGMVTVLDATPSEKPILVQGAKCGIAAAELSYWVFDVSRSEAYMAGLMQNVGAIYMGRHDSEKYMEIFKSQQAYPFSGYEKEIETYHTNHAFIGCLACKKWHMDPDIYKAILFHHDQDFAKKNQNNDRVRHLTALIMLSNYIVVEAEDDNYITQQLKTCRDLALKELALPENALNSARAAVNKWGNGMGLAMGSH